MTNPKNEWHGGNYNDAFWSGFWKGAKIGQTIVAVNNIIEGFCEVTRTADGVGSNTQPDLAQPSSETLQRPTPGNNGIPDAGTVQPNATVNGSAAGDMTGIDMKNPTGGGIRDDLQGSGLYGAPRTGNSAGHGGVDLLGTKVNAAHSGQVNLLPSNGYNAGVSITQATGGNTYTTVYQHINVVVSQGYVKQGTLIGIIIPSPTNLGITPHLHFEVFVNGVRDHPAFYIDKIPF
jgi:murein DD-endopeptidase MepM/ murein hydrolase activator NlpD